MQNSVAVFGGGCFWCMEAVFKMLLGVTSVAPGYAGGITVNPTYADVSSGRTGHAEVVRIEYDPAHIKYTDLLSVFFGSHDPTTMNRQDADVGTQYRSVIFTTTAEQERDATAFIKDANASSTMGDPIVTKVVPLDKFYPAEEYHKDYFARNPEQMYCSIVINPKLEKVKAHFAALLRENTK